MEAIHTSTHDDSSGIANETSDKITVKTGNETTQETTHQGTRHHTQAKIFARFKHQG
jgi:hypothetical protein